MSYKKKKEKESEKVTTAEEKAFVERFKKKFSLISVVSSNDSSSYEISFVSIYYI